jgi:putative DeoR family transcriptional regulator (stage III sporulation protein D)
MKDYIEERVLELTNYIIENNATMRQTAKKFAISKSTVHKDVTERLKLINNSLYKDVKIILNQNKAERHLRGGMATKQNTRLKNY